MKYFPQFNRHLIILLIAQAIAGSTLISQSYSGPEGFFVQGMNDALVYGTQSIASLVAGWLLFEIGWQHLVLVPIPLLVFLLIFTFSSYFKMEKYEN